MERFDLIVIGSGSGLEVSAAAAEQGWRVAVVEEGPFGGTCLKVGPTGDPDADASAHI